MVSLFNPIERSTNLRIEPKIWMILTGAVCEMRNAVYSRKDCSLLSLL